MEWAVAIGIVVAGIFLLPWAVSAMKRSKRGKRGGYGAAAGIGFAFSAVFDPASATAIETIQKKRETGDAESGVGGELLD